MIRYVIIAVLLGMSIMVFWAFQQLEAQLGMVAMVLGARFGWWLTRRETEWFAAYGPCFLCAFSIGGFVIAVFGHAPFMGAYAFSVIPSLVFAAPAALLATAPKRSDE